MRLDHLLSKEHSSPRVQHVSGRHLVVFTSGIVDEGPRRVCVGLLSTTRCLVSSRPWWAGGPGCGCGTWSLVWVGGVVAHCWVLRDQYAGRAWLLWVWLWVLVFSVGLLCLLARLVWVGVGGFVFCELDSGREHLAATLTMGLSPRIIFVVSC